MTGKTKKRRDASAAKATTELDRYLTGPDCGHCGAKPGQLHDLCCEVSDAVRKLTKAARDALGAKLLALGGKEVAWQEPEPHSQQLLSRGRLFTDPVRFCGGELNACHRNAARLWARAPDTRRIVVGYARNGDIWRQHTWVWNGKCLHETTYLFDQYFGAVLGNEEALHFWVSNIGKAGASTDLAEYNDYLDQFPALEEIMLKLILRLECRGLMKPGASPRDQARAGATGSPALQSAATL